MNFLNLTQSNFLVWIRKGFWLVKKKKIWQTNANRKVITPPGIFVYISSNIIW